ncbi:MAG TPA: response regulator [Chloroflexota bacterium]
MSGGGATVRPTVLLVDDEPKIHRLVHRVLEPAGFEVLDARDGQEAVEMLPVRRPDVVLLDVVMPRLDGMETCRRIRAVCDIPVVMLTGQSDEDTLVRGLGVGADDYLTKPFSPRELVARVRAVLRRAAGS